MGAAISLGEAVGRTNPGGILPAEPRLVRVSLPSITTTGYEKTRLGLLL